MERKTPGAGRTARRGEIGKPDSPNLVPTPENFNPGLRLLRDVMTEEWWASVLPEEVADDLHFARQVERAFKHGPVPFYYMLRECGRARGVMTHIETVVDTFADLDPEMIKAMGANEFVQLLAGIDGGKK